MKTFRVWGRRIFIVLGLLVSIYLVLDFNSRMTRLTRLRAQAEIEEQRYHDLSNTRAALQAHIAYVTSDKSVEDWARQEGRMMLPGDYVIIPMPDSDFIPEPVDEEIPIIEPDSYWEAWMQWLFFKTP